MKQNDVVWAKIKGFPWWPGVISSISKSKDQNVESHVNFLGDFTYARLPDSKLYAFEEKFKEFSNRKNKKLSEAIKIAEKILKGETNFEVEQRKLEKKSDIRKDRVSLDKDTSESISKKSQNDTPVNPKKSPIKILPTRKIPKDDSNKPKNRIKISKKRLRKKSYIRRSSRSNIRIDNTNSNVQESVSRASRQSDNIEKTEVIKNKIGRPKKSNIVNHLMNNERKKFYELEQFYMKTFDDILDNKSQKKGHISMTKIIQRLKKNLLQNISLPKISKTELFISKIGKYVMSIKLILEKYLSFGDIEHVNVLIGVIQLMDVFVSTLGKTVVNHFFEFDDLLQNKDNILKRNMFTANQIPIESINKKAEEENLINNFEKNIEKDTKQVEAPINKKKTPIRESKPNTNNDKAMHEEFMKEKESQPSDYKNYISRGMEIEKHEYDFPNNKKKLYEKGYTRSGRDKANNNISPCWNNDYDNFDKNNEKVFMNNNKKKREELLKKGGSENNEKLARNRSSDQSESISNAKKRSKSRSRSLPRSDDNCKKTKEVNFSYKANRTNIRASPKKSIFDSMKPIKKTTNYQNKNDALKTQDDKNLNYYTDKTKISQNMISEKVYSKATGNQKTVTNNKLKIDSEEAKNSTKSTPHKEQHSKKLIKSSRSVDNTKEVNDASADNDYNITVHMLIPTPKTVSGIINEKTIIQNKKIEQINENLTKPQEQSEKLISNPNTNKAKDHLKVPSPKLLKKDKKSAISPKDNNKKPLDLEQNHDSTEDYYSMKTTVLKKIARALIQQFNLSKKDAETIAINLENNNRASYIKDINNLENYKREIVNLIKSIKNRTLDQVNIMVKQEPASMNETMGMEDDGNMIFKEDMIEGSNSYQNT